MRRGLLSWQFACSTFAHEFRCADLRIDECFNILHIRRMNSFSQLTVFHFIQLFDTFLFIPAGVLSLSSLLWGTVTKIIDIVFIPMSCVSKTFYADSGFVLFTNWCRPTCVCCPIFSCHGKHLIQKKYSFV